MQNLGDYPANASVVIYFNSVDSNGAPVTLTGGSVGVYDDASDTEITAGITFTADADSRTGFHRAVVDLSNAAYGPGNDYTAVLTAGTVDGVNVSGSVLARFSCENRNIKADIVSQNGTAWTNVSDTYVAKVTCDPRYAIGGLENVWTVTWYKNGAPVTPTSVTNGLTVTNLAGTQVFQQTPVQMGSTGMYTITLTGANVLEPGTPVGVTLTATIDGSLRTFKTGYCIPFVNKVMDTVMYGNVAAGVSATSFVAASINCRGGSTTIAADTVINRWVLFVTGPNAGQAKRITDYNGSLTFTTEAFLNTPTANDQYWIVGAIQGA